MIVKRSSVEETCFEGLRIFDYTAGSDTSSSVAAIEVPPGVRHREAWSRRSDKYYYVAAGRIRFAVEGAEHDLGPGDLCLVRQGERFSYANPTQEVATLLLVHTPGFDLDSEVFVE